MRRVAVLAAALLVLSACAAESDSEPTATDVSGLRVVDEMEQVSAFAAWLSPDGHAIVYVDPSGPLQVVGKPGDTPKKLYDEKNITAQTPSRPHWVSGRLLVMVDGDTPYVLVLDD